MSDVSRETHLLLEQYVDLLIKWTTRINLIAPSTVEAVWERHIEDCLRSVRLAKGPIEHWIDIGSGGGLPGVVAAIFHRDHLKKISLIESDQRKCAFLRTVSRELGLQIKVSATRVEDTDLSDASIISARALAPLTKLLEMTSQSAAKDATLLFMKGRNWQGEVEEAERVFSFSYSVHPGKNEEQGVTLRISDVTRHTNGR